MSKSEVCRSVWVLICHRRRADQAHTSKLRLLLPDDIEQCGDDGDGGSSDDGGSDADDTGDGDSDGNRCWWCWW